MLGIIIAVITLACILYCSAGMAIMVKRSRSTTILLWAIAATVFNVGTMPHLGDLLFGVEKVGVMDFIMVAAWVCIAIMYISLFMNHPRWFKEPRHGEV